VGTLPTVLLRVSSGTILPTFIEIGSYLTDKEQNISWHSIFETRCRPYIHAKVGNVTVINHRLCNRDSCLCFFLHFDKKDHID